MAEEANPLVSIVVPAYNESDYIIQMLSSISAQTYEHLEVVLVDDGSTDTTLSLVEEYFSNADFSSARILENRTNMGATFSKNRGAVAAQGEYVIFHDADDVSVLGRIASQVSFMQANPDVGVVGTAVHYVDEPNDEWTVRTRPTDDATLRATAARECPVNIGSAMFRAEALYQTDLLASEFVEGYELVVEVARQWKLANLSEPMYAYRINTESRSKNAEMRKKAILVNRSYQAARALNGRYLDVFLSLGWFIYIFAPQPVKRVLRRVFSPTDDQRVTDEQRDAIEALL